MVVAVEVPHGTVHQVLVGGPGHAFHGDEGGEDDGGGDQDVHGKEDSDEEQGLHHERHPAAGWFEGSGVTPSLRAQRRSTRRCSSRLGCGRRPLPVSGAHGHRFDDEVHGQRGRPRWRTAGGRLEVPQLDPALRPVHGPSEGEQPEDPDQGRDVVQGGAEAGAVVVAKGKPVWTSMTSTPGEVGGQEPAPRVYTVAETEDDGGGEQQVEHRQVQDEVGIVDRHPRQPPRGNPSNPTRRYGPAGPGCRRPFGDRVGETELTCPGARRRVRNRCGTTWCSGPDGRPCRPEGCESRIWYRRPRRDWERRDIAPSE